MAEFVFVAKVHPDNVRVDFQVANPPLTLNVVTQAAGSCLVRLLLAGSPAVHVTTKNDVEDMSAFVAQIQGIVTAIYDTAVYTTGRYIGIDIAMIIQPPDRATEVRRSLPSIEQEAAADVIGIDTISRLALEHVTLRRALGDLREAIRTPDDAPFFAYRAVETIMQAFRDEKDETKVAWTRLRSELKISEQFLKGMTHFATRVRHGQSVVLPRGVAEELTLRARGVIHRYACWLSMDGKTFAKRAAEL